MASYDVILEAEPEAARGYAGLATERPVRLKVKAAEDAAATALDLTDQLARALGGLTRDAHEIQGDQLEPRGSPERAVLVWVGSASSASEDQEQEAADWLDEPGHDAVAVLPRGVPNPDEALPPSLALLHAVFGEPEEVVYEVLAAGGVVPLEQRLFVSYSHHDGAELAHALFDLLQRGRFDVFLDVASLEPGLRFAERIEHALADKAFLLLVETDRAVGSEWVQREVDFARRLRLGLAAIHPSSAVQLLTGIGKARRLTLDDGTELVQNGEPTDEGRRVLSFVRKLHSKALVRRRAAIENSLLAALDEAEVTEIERRAGGFDIRSNVRDYAVDLHPRPAALADFERLDRRAAADRAVLVSPRTCGTAERASLEWLSSRSGVAHLPETLMRALARGISNGAI